MYMHFLLLTAASPLVACVPRAAEEVIHKKCMSCAHSVGERERHFSCEQDANGNLIAFYGQENRLRAPCPRVHKPISERATFMAHDTEKNEKWNNMCECKQTDAGHQTMGLKLLSSYLFIGMRFAAAAAKRPLDANPMRRTNWNIITREIYEYLSRASWH